MPVLQLGSSRRVPTTRSRPQGMASWLESIVAFPDCVLCGAERPQKRERVEFEDAGGDKWDDNVVAAPAPHGAGVAGVGIVFQGTLDGGLQVRPSQRRVQSRRESVVLDPLCGC